MNQRIYLPFADSRWRMKMGLKPLKLEDWIEIDERFTAYLARKQELLEHHYREVFASLPGSERSQKEVLNLLLDYLPKHFPSHYQRQGDRIESLLVQQSWNVADFETNPLDLAGRLVQEDLCLMQPSPDGYILVAASVCFPFHWRLPDKLGQPLARIHQPVPEYAQKLEEPVNNFFMRLKTDCPGYRLNWGIVDTPDLSLARPRNPSRSDAPFTVDSLGEKLWLRVERQTVRRLETSNCVLFTIRTYIYPLSILESYPAIARNLSAAIQQMPLAMQRYKDILPVREVLLDYLGKIYRFVP
ncbi:hypothetical protein NIES593_01610 [Hydrococcus rivularis NIES-593]|uniref:DUF3445 domain-containing protein n=1 Tax=Hydrococcus rivularis NIES-593 TaxID=1921803 RepID=A0A1U7HT76_9CYAN|nr:DUF3445 domain-containing protein [Hydrococcus rivularis]OKH26769.1 hypothetical protein NIES593_01610 [Hydrococcus rivularis NIES-593]